MSKIVVLRCSVCPKMLTIQGWPVLAETNHTKSPSTLLFANAWLPSVFRENSYTRHLANRWVA